MARLPRGIKLTDPQIKGNAVVYTIEIARWRMTLLVLKALRSVRVRVTR